MKDSGSSIQKRCRNFTVNCEPYDWNYSPRFSFQTERQDVSQLAGAAWGRYTDPLFYTTDGYFVGTPFNGGCIRMKMYEGCVRNQIFNYFFGFNHLGPNLSEGFLSGKVFVLSLPIGFCNRCFAVCGRRYGFRIASYWSTVLRCSL